MADRRQGWACLAALAVLLVLAACSKATTAKGTAPRDDVVAATNGVCAQDVAADSANVDAYKARFPGGAPTPAAARDFLINTVAPRYDAIASSLHNLARPSKDGSRWDAALASLDRRLRDFKYQIDQDAVALAKAVGTTDPKTPTAAGALFVDFGAKDCASL